ncbi:MAG: hypothetical protein ABIF71_06110 [Planctomycetota bacterium]
MRHVFPAWLLGGVLLLVLGCGEKPPPVNPVVQPDQVEPSDGNGGGRPTQVLTSDEAIDRIRAATSDNDRAVMIRRGGRVDEAGRPAMIAFLNETLADAPSVYDRISAADGLITINTPKSLLPVKETLLFSMNGQLNAGILDSMHGTYGADFDATLGAWCAERLNAPEVAAARSEKEIMAALYLYAMVQKPDTARIDPAPYLNGPSPKVALKLYDIMRQYPRADLPLDQLRQRIAARLQNQSLSGAELKAFTNLVSAQAIPPEELDLHLSEYTLRMGLESNDQTMRTAVIFTVPLTWPNLAQAERTAVIDKLKEVAANDPYFQEGRYPVRDKAVEMIATLTGTATAPPPIETGTVEPAGDAGTDQP